MFCSRLAVHLTFAKLRDYDVTLHARHTGTKEQYGEYRKKGTIEDRTTEQKEPQSKETKNGVDRGIRDLRTQNGQSSDTKELTLGQTP